MKPDFGNQYSDFIEEQDPKVPDQKMKELEDGQLLKVLMTMLQAIFLPVFSRNSKFAYSP